MKYKFLFALLFVLFMMTCSSCGYTKIIPDGRWESESPKMYIDVGGAISTASGVNPHKINIGELVNDDGTVTKIEFEYLYEGWSIQSFQEYGKYIPEGDIYIGTYKLKGDILTLKLRTGGEIVLTKTGNLPTETSSSVPEKAFDISEFNALGTFICASDSFETEFHKKYPSTIPLIAFYSADTCHVRVNYGEGMCDVAGFYTIEGENINVKLDFRDTIFEGIGTEYMDNQYVFSIVSNKQIVIDRDCYTVNQGDCFVKTQ